MIHNDAIWAYDYNITSNYLDFMQREEAVKQHLNVQSYI